MKHCPFCAEEIQDAAIKCRHCGEFLNRAETGNTKKAPPPSLPVVEPSQPSSAVIVKSKDDPLGLRARRASLEKSKPAEPVSSGKKGEFRQEPKYIHTAIALLLFTGMVGVWTSVKESGKISSPVNIIDLIIFYYLAKKRSETARIVFLIRLLLGMGFGGLMAMQRSVGEGLVILGVYTPILLLVAGQSNRRNMILALSIYVPIILLMIAGIFL